MIIGIHPDRIGKVSYSDKWAEFLQARGVETRVLNLLAQDALEQASKCDGVMCCVTHHPHDKQSTQKILYTIENYLNIPVYPDSKTAWHYDEKVFQHYLLQSVGAPMPADWLFWDRNSADEWAASAPYPLVFKLSSGAASSNVIKVKNYDQARELIWRMFRRGVFPNTMNEYDQSRLGAKQRLALMVKRLRDGLSYIKSGNYPALDRVFWKPEAGYIYFQEFLPGNEFDTRVTVIGGRAFGFRRLNRPGDFRASGSGKIEFTPDLINPDCVRIALEVSRKADFQSMAYDFLLKDGAPVIGEISYTFADWAVEQCPGHWDNNLNWVEGRMWPEEAQVDDFLGRIRNKTGNISHA